MIALGSDHGGLALKQHVMQYLDAHGLAYKDFGCYTSESCDYPDFARPAAQAAVSHVHAPHVVSSPVRLAGRYTQGRAYHRDLGGFCRICSIIGNYIPSAESFTAISARKAERP